MFFSTVATNIDNKYLTKNKEQGKYELTLFWDSDQFEMVLGSSATAGLDQILKQRKYREWKSREKDQRVMKDGRCEREKVKGECFSFVFIPS